MRFADSFSNFVINGEIETKISEIKYSQMFEFFELQKTEIKYSLIMNLLPVKKW